jgi:type IV pilus assembly protein PilV
MKPERTKLLTGGRKTNQKGFTLIEACFAISILSIGLLGMASMQVSSINGNASAGYVTDGTTLAGDQLEKLMALPYTDADLSAGTHSAPSPPTGYTINWSVTDDSPYNDTKTIDLTVTWNDHGATKRVTMQRVIARII